MGGGWLHEELWRGMALTLAAVAPLGALLAWLLRLSRAPGGSLSAGLLGGVLAGVLLGPGVLGRAAPRAHEAVFVGSAEHEAALREIDARAAREGAVLASTGVTPEAVAEWRAALDAERNAALRALGQAREARAMGVTGAGVAAFGLFLACAPRRQGARRAGWPGSATGVWAGAASFGFAAVPSGLAAAWLGGAGQMESWMFGAACGVGGVCVAPRALRSVPAVDRPDVRGAAFVAFVLGMAAAVIGAVGGSVGAGGRVCGIAVATCALAGAARRAPGRGAASRASRRAVGALRHGLLAPVMAGVLVAQQDLSSGAGRVFVVGAVAAVVLAHDGRWIGAWIGFGALGGRAPGGRKWGRAASAMDAEAGAMGVGIALLGVAGGLITAPMALAGALGAVVVEASAGARRAVSRRLDGRGAGPPA